MEIKDGENVDMGSPIKGLVPPQKRRAGKEKKHPSIKKIDIFFNCHLSGTRPPFF